MRDLAGALLGCDGVLDCEIRLLDNLGGRYSWLCTQATVLRVGDSTGCLTWLLWEGVAWCNAVPALHPTLLQAS
jgi:hypothetical protein